MAYHLPAPAQEFMERHPGVQLRLRADIQPAELVRMLEQGEADLALLAYDRDAERNPYLAYRDLYELHLYLLMAPGHALARKKRVRVTELAQYPLVMEPEGSLPRQVLDRLAVRHNLAGKLHIVTEGATLDVLRRYVARGIGVSMIFLDRTIINSLDDLHVRLFEPGESVPVALVTRQGGHLPEAAEQFTRILQRHLPGT
jgi:DNA-binding transcriptional LysR family regulator